MSEQERECKLAYRKINKQMKFQFLHRVLAQGQPINEAAEEIGIHYSTAKTIIFFHKHNHKSYRNFKLEDTAPIVFVHRAQYRQIQPDSIKANPIMVISNSHFEKWQARKQVKAGNISLTYLRKSKPRNHKYYSIQKKLKKSRPPKEMIKLQMMNPLITGSLQQGQGSDSSFICYK